jgi:hypothetical protein
MTYARCVTEIPIKTDYFLHQLFSLELKYCFFYEERIHTKKKHTHTLRKQGTCIFFFTMAQQPQWAKAYSLSRIHDHTQTHHTR